MDQNTLAGQLSKKGGVETVTLAYIIVGLVRGSLSFLDAP
jgi:hypothetical protein